MTGIVIVGREGGTGVGEAFSEMVKRVASRLPGTPVVATALSNEAELGEYIDALVVGGADHVLVLPCFLPSEEYVTRIAKAAAGQRPGVRVEVLPPLAGDPSFDDFVAERLRACLGMNEQLPTSGAEIEKLSHEIIDRRLNSSDWDERDWPVVRRVVHATADFSFVETMRIHGDAVPRAVEALRAGKPVICDTHMVAAGITRSAGAPICAIREQDVAARAKAEKTTRSSAAMAHLADRMDGAVVAIGNAPTALMRVIEMSRAGKISPAVVIGLPVGFVGARESKLALFESGLCHVTNLSARGGSPAAAAAANALALIAKREDA